MMKSNKHLDLFEAASLKAGDRPPSRTGSLYTFYMNGEVPVKILTTIVV